MNDSLLRAAVLDDLPSLVAVEDRCFASYRRSSPRAIRHSLLSPTQDVWVATQPTSPDRREIVGVLVLHMRRQSVRIYSLAVMPAFRKHGIGRRLMDHAIKRARRQSRCAYLSLEADAGQCGLRRWYERFGFETISLLKDYYAPGKDAVRMRRPAPPAKKGNPARVSI